MSELRRGTYCRERDGAFHLYHSEITTWNVPIDALERYLDERIPSTSLNQWEIVRSAREQDALKKELGDWLKPGESFVYFDPQPNTLLTAELVRELMENSKFAERVKFERILGFPLESEQIEVLSRFKRAVMKQHHREPFDEEYRMVSEMKEFEPKPKPQFVKEYVGTDEIEGGFIDKVDNVDHKIVIHTHGETYFLEVDTEYDTFGGCSTNFKVFRNKLRP